MQMKLKFRKIKKDRKLKNLSILKIRIKNPEKFVIYYQLIVLTKKYHSENILMGWVFVI